MVEGWGFVDQGVEGQGGEDEGGRHGQEEDQETVGVTDVDVVKDVEISIEKKKSKQVYRESPLKIYQVSSQYKPAIFHRETPNFQVPLHFLLRIYFLT